MSVTNRLKFLIIGLLSVTASCTVAPSFLPTPSDRTAIEEVDLWPEVGYITESDTLICSVVMIETDIALTAAHCVEWVGEYVVHLSNGKSSAVVHIETADWNREFDNDIAVLFLNDSIIDRRFLPVLMDREISLRDMGTQVVSVGWSNNEKAHEWSWLLAGLKGSDMLFWLADPGHLWYGDSGGGMFLLIDGKVVLAGINAIVLFSDWTRTVLGSGATEIVLHADWLEEVIDAYRSN